MAVRDNQLKFRTVPLTYKDGHKVNARAEGNNAFWNCACGEELPMSVRSYYQFGEDCHSFCPKCNRKFRGYYDPKADSKRISEVKEI